MAAVYRKIAAVLKRLDTLAAAALVGVSVAPASSAWLCAESSCRSGFDTAMFYALALAAAASAGLVFWRSARRWWTRALILAAMLYSSAVVPAWIWRHGRWTIPLQSGTSCVVRAGATREEVRRSCGEPTYRCEGPKFVESASLWNPLSLTVCGFTGDVYATRLVTYGCSGDAAEVTGFDGGPPESSRPPHCVWWSR